MNKRDVLYNSILEAVKKHSSGMVIGQVVAVLAEVEGDISRQMSRQGFEIIQDKLEMRKPRE